jgi:regulator of replication initiation timing
MMVYGLTYEDIAHLRAKDKQGLYKTTADMPKELNDYIEEHNPLDLELWKLANARLDAAIQQLQPECFQHHLAMFAKVQAAVKDGCSNYQQFYAEHGLSNQTYAYVSDNGIGYR